VVDISRTNSEFQDIENIAVWGATPLDVNSQ
jgi:hypothetical protein